MLYGIRPAEQRRLASTGARMRVYVPYGGDWYGYLVRRLAERPANLSFFLRSLRRRGRLPVIAILGTGKMGEALLSGLLRAGRPPSARGRRGPARGPRRRAPGAVRDRGRPTPRRPRSWPTPWSWRSSRRTWASCWPRSRPPCRRAGWWSRWRPGSPRRSSSGGWPARCRSSGSCRTRPVLVDEAMSVVSAGAHAGEEHLRRAEELLRPVGKVLRIPESQQDAATALSGSGPAYVYYLVESMVDAGDPARHGARRRAGDGHPDGLRRGHHAAGVGRAPGDPARGRHLARAAPRSPRSAELERHGVRAAFLAAIEAARDRGRELGADPGRRAPTGSG